MGIIPVLFGLRLIKPNSKYNMALSIKQKGLGKRPLLNEINVTPFVDVLLILLIIFMVTAPLLKQGLDIALPESSSARAVKPSKEPFVLSIKKDKKIYIEEHNIPFEALAEKLNALFEHKQEKIIYLEADKTLPYGFVAQTLGEIQSAGISQISLIVTQK